jgi:hypothetical protein
MHWEVLPHPTCSPDVTPSDFHLLGVLIEAIGEKYLEPTMKLNFLCNDGWAINHKLLWKGHIEAARATATVCQGSGRRWREIGITF